VLKFDQCPDSSVIRIYTLSGELVREYADVSNRALWDGKNQQNSDVASGVYLYRLEAPDGQKYQGKIFLVR
jgi:hypothetical protein